MACLLRVSGSFDLGEIAVPETLVVERRWAAGETDILGRENKESGVQIPVSTASLSDFAGQVGDAERFLQQHREAVRALATLPGVVHRTLDFGLEDDGGGGSLSFRLPGRLIDLAAECRLEIELSLYRVDSEKRQSDRHRLGRLVRRGGRSPS